MTENEIVSSLWLTTCVVVKVTDLGTLNLVGSKPSHTDDRSTFYQYYLACLWRLSPVGLCTFHEQPRE